jgi:hypothetical protein
MPQTVYTFTNLPKNLWGRFDIIVCVPEFAMTINDIFKVQVIVAGKKWDVAGLVLSTTTLTNTLQSGPLAGSNKGNFNLYAPFDADFQVDSIVITETSFAAATTITQSMSVNLFCPEYYAGGNFSPNIIVMSNGFQKDQVEKFVGTLLVEVQPDAPLTKNLQTDIPVTLEDPRDIQVCQMVLANKSIFGLRNIYPLSDYTVKKEAGFFKTVSHRDFSNYLAASFFDDLKPYGKAIMPVIAELLSLINPLLGTTAGVLGKSFFGADYRAGSFIGEDIPSVFPKPLKELFKEAKKKYNALKNKREELEQNLKILEKEMQSAQVQDLTKKKNVKQKDNKNQNFINLDSVNNVIKDTNQIALEKLDSKINRLNDQKEKIIDELNEAKEIEILKKNELFLEKEKNKIDDTESISSEGELFEKKVPLNDQKFSSASISSYYNIIKKEGSYFPMINYTIENETEVREYMKNTIKDIKREYSIFFFSQKGVQKNLGILELDFPKIQSIIKSRALLDLILIKIQSLLEYDKENCSEEKENIREKKLYQRCKAFLSNISVLPELYLNLQGVPVKKESIEFSDPSKNYEFLTYNNPVIDKEVVLLKTQMDRFIEFIALLEQSRKSKAFLKEILQKINVEHLYKLQKENGLGFFENFTFAASSLQEQIVLSEEQEQQEEGEGFVQEEEVPEEEGEIFTGFQEPSKISKPKFEKPIQDSSIKNLTDLVVNKISLSDVKGAINTIETYNFATFPSEDTKGQMGLFASMSSTKNSFSRSTGVIVSKDSSEALVVPLYLCVGPKIILNPEKAKVVLYNGSCTLASQKRRNIVVLPVNLSPYSNLIMNLIFLAGYPDNTIISISTSTTENFTGTSIGLALAALIFQFPFSTKYMYTGSLVLNNKDLRESPRVMKIDRIEDKLKLAFETKRILIHPVQGSVFGDTVTSMTFSLMRGFDTISDVEVSSVAEAFTFVVLSMIKTPPKISSIPIVHAPLSKVKISTTGKQGVVKIEEKEVGDVDKLLEWAKGAGFETEINAYNLAKINGKQQKINGVIKDLLMKKTAYEMKGQVKKNVPFVVIKNYNSSWQRILKGHNSPQSAMESIYNQYRSTRPDIIKNYLDVSGVNVETLGPQFKEFISKKIEELEVPKEYEEQIQKERSENVKRSEISKAKLKGFKPKASKLFGLP